MSRWKLKGLDLLQMFAVCFVLRSLSLWELKNWGKNDSHFEVSIYGVSNGLVQPPSRIVVVFFRWD